MTRVLILNGTSSSGKSTLARALQAALPGAWLHFGVDDFIRALPAGLPGGITFGDGGEVRVGDAFRRLELAWMSGLAATARAGANLIVDDVFLGGAETQARWSAALGDLPTLWVGVDCDLAVAGAREAARPDRTPGMTRQQAGVVHTGVRYDLRLDTSADPPEAVARRVAAALLARLETGADATLRP